MRGTYLIRYFIVARVYKADSALLTTIAFLHPLTCYTTPIGVLEYVYSMRYRINVDTMTSFDGYIIVYCASLQDLPNSVSLSRDSVAECSRCPLLL
jgi:hypothetical protein